MQYTFPVPVDEKDLRPAFNIEKRDYSNPDAISAEVERYLNNYSPRTVRAYRSDLYDFWNFTKQPLQHTKEDHVLRYIEYLESKDFSNSTINRRIASLSKLCSIYVAMGLMKYNPVQNLSALRKLYKPISPVVSNVLSLHDVEKVIQGARKPTAIITKTLANTGLRVSELLSITKNDIEPKSHEYLSVRIRNGKGGKNRYIYLSYSLYAEIKEVFDGDSIYLFASKSGKQLSRINVYKQIHRAFLKYAERSASPHSLRHFFATRKISVEKKDIKAVSTYLGHNDPGLTLRVYVQNFLEPEETVII